MSALQLVVGLGNPGTKYAGTRHNLGFMVIDQIVVGQDLGEPQKTKNYQLWMWQPGHGQKILLVKPVSYMNNSGEVVSELVRFFKIADEDILIIHDDIDLDKGQIRLRQGGASGGHNGLKSIEQHLGHEAFKRIKIGVSRPPVGVDAEQYVLQPFVVGAEKPWSDRIVDAAAHIVVLLALHKKEFVEETVSVEIWHINMSSWHHEL